GLAVSRVVESISNERIKAAASLQLCVALHAFAKMRGYATAELMIEPAAEGAREPIPSGIAEFDPEAAAQPEKQRAKIEADCEATVENLEAELHAFRTAIDSLLMIAEAAWRERA